MTTDVRRELEAALSPGVPLPQALDVLRGLRHSGASRDEVRSALEGLRESARDEATEDRILELLDYVCGFCSVEQTIWED